MSDNYILYSSYPQSSLCFFPYLFCLSFLVYIAYFISTFFIYLLSFPSFSIYLSSLSLYLSLCFLSSFKLYLFLSTYICFLHLPLYFFFSLSTLLDSLSSLSLPAPIYFHLSTLSLSTFIVISNPYCFIQMVQLIYHYGLHTIKNIT